MVSCVGEWCADVNIVNRVGLFYQWQFECTEILWQDPEVPFILLHHLMFQHDNAWPHVARICTQNWKWPCSSMACILTHWACLGCSWSTSTTVYSSSLQNIQQLRTAAEEEWDNIPRATINSLSNSMWRRCVVLHEANGGHTWYWLACWSTPLPFLKGICDQQTHICIPSHLKSVD